MSIPAMPHDALFRALVSNPKRAASLLNDYLPPKLASLVDREHPPVQLEGSFIDEEAARTQCDALFELRLRIGDPVKIYVLLEHKSSADAATPLQLAGYMLRIWRRDLEATRASGPGCLTPILPIVFRHGPGNWTAPLSLAEMIAAPEGLEDLVRGFGYTLHELGDIEPRKLSREPDVLAGLLALAFVHVGILSRERLDLITAGLLDGSDLTPHLSRYASDHYRITPQAMTASLRRTQPDKWETIMGTLSEALAEQGRIEGIAEGKVAGIAEGKVAGIAEGKVAGIAEGKVAGIAEGKADTLLRQLRLRFGDVPSARQAEIRSATTERLDTWSEALIFASDLDAVFEGSSRH